MRRESSPRRFYRCSDLALLRNESKMAKDPGRETPLQASSQATISANDCALQLQRAPRGKAHQEASFSKSALNGISNRGPGSLRWWFCRQHSLRPHNESLCSSLRFNPDVCAERWAGGFKHFQKYTRCLKSMNQPHINMTHSCQQHPILPSRGLLLCQSLTGPQRTPGCACGGCSAPPSRLLREEKGEADGTAVEPAAGLPAVQETLMSARGCAWCPILATEEGQGQSCLLRGCTVQGLISPGRTCLVGPGWSGQDGRGLEPY